MRWVARPSLDLQLQMIAEQLKCWSCFTSVFFLLLICFTSVCLLVETCLRIKGLLFLVYSDHKETSPTMKCSF